MAAMGARGAAGGLLGGGGGGGKERQIDTEPFDTAVAMILKWWKPPPDMKRVIVSEIGAILALTSNDTKMAGKARELGGPRAKMSNTFKQAFTAIKIKYEPWKKYIGGRPPKGKRGSLKVFKIGGKKYYRRKGRSRYSDATWAMINAGITRARRKALLAAGSSKAAWMRMLFLSYKEAGFAPKVPASWKEAAYVRRVTKHMTGKGRWSKVTKAQKEASPAAGNFVVKVQSSAHNTLNPGVKGFSSFQRRIKGRQPAVAKAFTKKMKMSMKMQLKKFPGMDVPG